MHPAETGMQKDPEEFIWDVKRPGKVKMQTATNKCRQALLPTVSAPDSTIVYELETAIVAHTDWSVQLSFYRMIAPTSAVE